MWGLVTRSGAFLMAALLGGLSHAPVLAQARLAEPLEAYVGNAMAQAQMPGLAVTVVHGDDPPIAQGFGVRRLGRPERVDADTLFNIASLAKSFSAASAAALVDEGRLNWDDGVARRLPQVEFSDPWLTRHVTLADLLSHRTGLQAANTAWYDTGIDRHEILARIRYLKPAAAFRTQQVYNNALYVVAGELVGAAAGTSWEEVVRTRLLAPLGMTRTLVGMPPTKAGNVAAPHAVVEGRHQPIAPTDYVSTAPAGGIESTARDMAHWLQFQLGDGTFSGRRILSGQSLQAMHEPWALIPTTPEMRRARRVQFFGAYGLGWNIMDYRGHKLLWHSGNADGMPAYMALVPERRLGVVVLLNSWIASDLRIDLTLRILDHYLGLSTRDYAAETLRARQAWAQAAPSSAPAGAALPPLDLAAYEGSYSHPLFGPILVRHETAGLVLRLGRGEVADLAPLGRDRFTVRWRNRVKGVLDTRVAFGVDAQGQVTRLTMSMRRDEIEAKRGEPSP